MRQSRTLIIISERNTESIAISNSTSSKQPPMQSKPEGRLLLFILGKVRYQTRVHDIHRRSAYKSPTRRQASSA